MKGIGGGEKSSGWRDRKFQRGLRFEVGQRESKHTENRKKSIMI